MEGIFTIIVLALLVLAIANIIMPFFVIAINGKLSRMLTNQQRTAREINEALLILTEGKHRPQRTTESELGGPSQTAPINEEATTDQLGFDENGERVYHGVKIRNVDNKYHVGDQVFSTLGKAKRYISERA